MIKLFLTHLLFQLDRERPGWRSNTMLVFDNASYHTNSNVQDYMVRNNINYLYTGPRSYDFNAIEAVWALLKMKDMNPENVPIGKR